MKPFLPLTPLLLSSLLHADAATHDSDLDGVSDALDKCPGTPIELTVSSDGCPVGSAGSEINFLAGLGMSYTTGTYGGTTPIDALSTDFTLAAYFGDFYLSVLGSYYFYGAYDPTVASSDAGGLSDTYIAAGYTFRPTSKLSLTPSLYVKLATAEAGMGTGENDAGASLLGIYGLGKTDLFAMYGYTVTGDTPEVTYNDISYGSAGFTYYPSLGNSLSLSYDFSQSYVPGVTDLQSITAVGVVALYDTLSLQINYSLGLSDSASKHALGVMLFKRF